MCCVLLIRPLLTAVGKLRLVCSFNIVEQRGKERDAESQTKHSNQEQLQEQVDCRFNQSAWMKSAT